MSFGVQARVLLPFFSITHGDLSEGSASLIKILILRKRTPELPCGVPLDCSQYTPFIFHLILRPEFVGGGGLGHIHLSTPLTM